MFTKYNYIDSFLKKQVLYLSLIFICFGNAKAIVWNNPYDIGTSQWKYAASVAKDFDGDGDIDILVTGQREAVGDYTARIYINDGSGSFTENSITNVSTIGNFRISKLYSEDFNSDGKPDLILKYYSAPSSKTELYINDGNGTSFTRKYQWASVAMQAFAAGDLDTDGDIDFLIIDSETADNIKKYENDGSANFTITQVELLGDDAAPVDGGFIDLSYGSIQLFDIDGDNDLDFVSVYSDSGGNIEAALQVFTNNGSGTFSQLSILIDNADLNFTVTAAPVLLAINLDTDGDTDLLLIDNTGVFEFFNNGSGSFSTNNVSISAGQGVQGAYSGTRVGDFDADGDDDILFWDFAKFFQAVNDGSNNFTVKAVDSGPTNQINGQPIPGKSMNPQYGSVDFADFDGDGIKDLHVFSYFTPVTNFSGLFGSLCPLCSSTVSITTTTKISDTEYSFTANPDDNGGTAITAKGIVWSTTPNPTITDYDGIATAPAGGNDEYTLNATNLQIGPGYYVRAYATNSTVTAYSEQVHFGVVPTLPEWGLIILAGGFVVFGGWFVFKKIV